ncbi:undecaprenyl-phosphate glucose phosphotransferase [Paraburkholderia caribensis]|uniref:Undecaprenyl-phosphate glucose phosphotransferase n=1 Tax=Paraburkholderia caribensis TaxID=75105 RepID=A0A9Q6S7S6_9BURK|nr:undecaprenyl-phosphate glucose phosphotransferase [Paraburkholderia caribensis]MCO4880885.1 undecaprenyl-phosphate glucose phosphotransferase [Paraburkholderia caribensis]PTB24630.1 undecaprenyl-phosphate glucose phosphotransferase [Paraburkholderia caribensis]QLB66189.1 undecaprenyl-phosphate glucose phosphotransferase [Paraburkholderia caribensis]
MLTPISKAADFLCISGSAYISKSIVFRDSSMFTHIDGLVGLLGLTLPFLTFRLTKVYQPFRNDSGFGSVIRALVAWLFAQLILVAISQPYPDVDPRNRWLLWWTAIAFCALVVGRCAIHALPTMLRSWRFAPTRVAIVAPRGAKPDLLARIALQTRNAFVPQVIFDPFLPSNTAVDQIPVVREMNALKQVMRAEKLREIWIINPPFQPISVEHLFETFRNDFVNIRVLPVLEGSTLAESVVDIYRGVPVLNVIATPERGWDTLPKEIFDRIFALFVLLAISPILLAISVAVKLSSPGPIFFRQYRKGMNGNVFSIYKFRTMYQGADKPGTVVQARKGDARVTRVGRILRSTSLDELPQFFNVMKGEMSVVGPRPHAVEHDEYYKNLVQHYMFRYRIKPGITGWAQVNGYRGETVEIEKMEARVRFDMHYIQHWTFWLDIKIIALTVANGFTGSSAY